jgi:hypothetical protein
VSSKGLNIGKSYNNEDLAYLFTDFNKKISEKVKSFDLKAFDVRALMQIGAASNLTSDTGHINNEASLPLHEEDLFKPEPRVMVNKKYYSKFNKISENEYITNDNIYVKLQKQDLTIDPLGVKTTRTNNIEEAQKSNPKKARKQSQSSEGSIDIPDL